MRRFLPWLLVPLLPVAVVLGILALQDAPTPAPSLPPVEALPEEAAPASAREHSFTLLRADGSPASDGVVILTDPAVETASIDAAGVCRFTLRSTAPMRLLAWAPGHRVREAGPWLSPPLELRLDALEDIPASFSPLQQATLRIRLTLEDGTPLAGALMLARTAVEPESAPWLAFADEAGLVECEVEAAPLLLQVFAPGRVPRPAWMLASRDGAPEETVQEWGISVAQLEVAGLPAMEPVQLRRDGEVLDLIAAGDDGFVRWTMLTPGAWELSTASGRMRLELETGLRRVSWAPDTSP